VETEIIIVDNCSKEIDLEAVQKLCAVEGCTFIANKENRGYNAGNNVGLRYAAENGYEYALITNPDMEFTQLDYVARLAGQMEQDDQIVVAGSDIIGSDGIHQNPMERDGDWRTSFSWVRGCFRKKAKDSSYNFTVDWGKNHYCDKLSGCCLMVRMDFIRQISFFDESVFLYCEEPILSRQVELSEKRMYYLATSQAVHAHIKSEKGDPVVRFKHWRQSRLYFIDHYSGYSMVGRWMAKFSVCLYTASYQLFRKLTK